MVFPIVGGTQSTGYEISNSLRFNSPDNAHLHITPNASNRDLYTISLWAKRSSLNNGVRQVLFGVGNPGTTNQVGFEIRFDNSPGDGVLRITDYVAGVGDYLVLKTNALFRDPSAWYHIVFVYDSAQGTNSNRAKVYVNGNQITSFSTATYPDQNQDSAVGSNTKHLIGAHDNSQNEYDGYMTEVHYIDGAAKAQTDFGEFDDNAVWIPKKYTGTYGTNGFFLEFKQTGTSANSSGMGADTSGNDNHLTPTNLAATDVTEDTCTNNFATLNSVDANTAAAPTLAEGNLDFHAPSGTPFTPARSTIAVSQGKWYMEYKFIDEGGGVGVMTTQSPINDHLRDDADVRSVYRGHGGYYYGRNNGGAVDDDGGNSVTLSANDIVGVALDLDNGYVYFSKNGTYMNGQDGSTQGNPAGNNGGSGGAANVSSQLLTNQHDGVWAFMAYDISTSTTGRVQCNFGNPPYSISSGNNDGKYGNFEYAPPSGFYALCTKRLAEFG